MATFDPDEMLLQADQAIDTNDIVRGSFVASFYHF